MKFLVLALCFLAVATAAPLESTTTEAPAGCIFKGIEYAAGSTYHADCNTCHCAGNNLAMCTLMACLDHGRGGLLDGPLSTTTTTEAPAGCLYGGIEYAAGSTYHADCNTCHCVGNDLAMCTLMACLDHGPGGPLGGPL